MLHSLWIRVFILNNHSVNKPHIYYNLLIKKVSWKKIHAEVHLGQTGSEPCWSVILLKPLWAFNGAKATGSDYYSLLQLLLLLLLIAVISIALYLTDTDEHTVH